LSNRLTISRAIGDDRGIARALAHLADVAARSDDLERAKSLYIDSLEIRRALGDLPGIASGMEKLASVITARDPRGAGLLLGAAEKGRELIRAARTSLFGPQPRNEDTTNTPPLQP